MTEAATATRMTETTQKPEVTGMLSTLRAIPGLRRAWPGHRGSDSTSASIECVDGEGRLRAVRVVRGACRRLRCVFCIGCTCCFGCIRCICGNCCIRAGPGTAGGLRSLCRRRSLGPRSLLSARSASAVGGSGARCPWLSVPYGPSELVELAGVRLRTVLLPGAQ